VKGALCIHGHPPPVSALLNLSERDVVDADEPLRLPDGQLGSLHGERVRRAPAVAVEVELPVEVPVEDRIEVIVLDPSEVEALGQDDEVAGETVAADVRGLPHPGWVDLVFEPVVERAAVFRAAPVSLPVRADDHERMLDGDPWHLPAEERVREVVVEQIVVMLELERVEPLLTRSRVAQVEHAAGLSAPRGLLDEEEPRMAEPGELVAQMGL
jgi:hypothetical protein